MTITVETFPRADDQRRVRIPTPSDIRKIRDGMLSYDGPKPTTAQLDRVFELACDAAREYWVARFAVESAERWSDPGARQ